MSTRVLLPRVKRRAAPVKAKPVSHRRVGGSGPVSVQYDPALGAQGQAVATAITASAAADYQRVAALFSSITPPSILVSIDQLSPASDGTGGAWHTTCSDTTLHCDACFADPTLTSALWIAEFTEVLEALQAKGWSCGDTNGEGLSRVVAEWAYPGVLDLYECASVWLDGARPNYVNSQQGTDTDDESNGLGPLFLWWLISLGYSLPDIVGDAGATLAATYASLTGKDSAWADFQSAVNALWPAGRPSGVTADNPWPTGAPAPPSPPAPPASAPSTLILSGQDPPGQYVLVAVAKLQALVASAKLSSNDLQALIAELGTIPVGSPPAATATAPGAAAGPGKPAAPAAVKAARLST